MVQEMRYSSIIFSSMQALFHQLEKFVKSLKFLLMHSCCLCHKILCCFWISACKSYFLFIHFVFGTEEQPMSGSDFVQLLLKSSLKWTLHLCPTRMLVWCLPLFHMHFCVQISLQLNLKVNQ